MWNAHKILVGILDWNLKGYADDGVATGRICSARQLEILQAEVKYLGPQSCGLCG
jgi:hypothetical protein